MVLYIFMFIMETDDHCECKNSEATLNKKRSSNGKKTERERGTAKEKGNVRSKYHRITYERSAVCY